MVEGNGKAMVRKRGERENTGTKRDHPKCGGVGARVALRFGPELPSSRFNKGNRIRKGFSERV